MTPLTTARRRLVDATGDELRALLAPIAPETFVRDYWGRKPLFVKGFAEKFAGFFDGAAFSEALTMPGPQPDDFLRASFDRKTAAGTSAVPRLAGDLRSTAFRASIEQAVPLYEAGATLCMSQVELRIPHLAPFLASIKRQLGFPGRATFNAYLSPRGSGFNWHFDARIASTLQIEGSKTWRFSNAPAIAWPRGNGSVRADGTPHYAEPGISSAAWETLCPLDEHETTEVELEPGDLLILPAGVWHEACGGSEGSLALNLSFTPISYTAIVRRLLDTLLQPEAGWRSPQPLFPGVDPGSVDPAGLAALEGQLARAAEALSGLRGDSAEVARIWAEFVQNPNPLQPPPFSPPRDVPAITPEQHFRVRADGNVYALLADGGTRLCLMVAQRAVELSGEAVPFVQRILREGTFVAYDCRAWNDGGQPFAWNDVATMLLSLAQEGLIEAVEAA
jgi:ribosomal protein L16 Arg81 hydroxylase